MGETCVSLLLWGWLTEGGAGGRFSLYVPVCSFFYSEHPPPSSSTASPNISVRQMMLSTLEKDQSAPYLLITLTSGLADNGTQGYLGTAG